MYINRGEEYTKLRRSHFSEYRTWLQIRNRCYNSNHERYKDYGGRGIEVCDRWYYSFENFIEDMGPRPDGLTLERVNNDSNYELSNCKWATPLEQSRNRPNYVKRTWQRDLFL